MPNMNGTRDALTSLKDAARRAGKNFDPQRVGRRGCAGDGGKSGRLVLVDANGKPEQGTDGKEIAVQWCTTGEQVPNFPTLA